jgi:transcriptional regulator with XRE-family HTH domain
MKRAIDHELAQISERIRSWREEGGHTLQELAKRSGVATSTIQKVETAQMIPSLAILLKIAHGLGRRPAELVGEDSQAVEVIHTTSRSRLRAGVEESMLCERLCGDLVAPAVEMWRVTLAPGMSSGHALRWEGEEIVVCERGTLTCNVGEERYLLRSGDTLHFKASQLHGWRNDSDAPVRFTVTGTFPQKLRALLSGRVAENGRSGRRKSGARAPRRPASR